MERTDSRRTHRRLQDADAHGDSTAHCSREHAVDQPDEQGPAATNHPHHQRRDVGESGGNGSVSDVVIFITIERR